jgi:hypothetical protein
LRGKTASLFFFLYTGFFFQFYYLVLSWLEFHVNNLLLFIYYVIITIFKNHFAYWHHDNIPFHGKDINLVVCKELNTIFFLKKISMSTLVIFFLCFWLLFYFNWILQNCVD